MHGSKMCQIQLRLIRKYFKALKRCGMTCTQEEAAKCWIIKYAGPFRQYMESHCKERCP